VVRDRIKKTFSFGIVMDPEQLSDVRKVLGAEGYERPPMGHGQSLRRLRLEAMRSAATKRSG